MKPATKTGRRIKRTADLAIATAMLMLLWPVMLVVCILVRWRLGRPVIFRQARPGFNEQPFVLYKFRTMTDLRGPRGEELPDAARLTLLGIFLRRSSLDELPQLWNVMRGEMSLIGPRPLRLDYLDFFTERERLRHAVRPGITGWAQVHGRNTATWDERLANDVWYVENWSLALDFKIAWKTLRQVFQRKDVIADAHSIMLNLNEERAERRREAA